MSTNYSTDHQAIDAFIQLFEWAYEVQFRPDQRAAIEEEILRGWSNTDVSENELLGYILDAYDLVTSTRHSNWSRLKSQAQSVFQSHFGLNEENDRSRILATVYQAIEELRPGVTPVSSFPQPKYPSSSSVVSHPGNTGTAPSITDTLEERRKQDIETLKVMEEMERWESYVEKMKRIFGSR